MKRKKSVFVSLLLLTGLCLFLTLLFYTNLFNHLIFWKPVKIHQIKGNYVLREIAAPLKPYQVSLPDISKYNYTAVVKKMPAGTETGKISILPIADIPETQKLMEGSMGDRLKNLQGKTQPVGIVIESGVYDLGKLNAELKNPDLLEIKNGVFYLRAPLIVKNGATLKIGVPSRHAVDLKLVSGTGTFIASSGMLFIVNANISAWDDAANMAAVYDEKQNNFRPFIVAWDGSETYMARSRFQNLGFDEAKAYGITFSSDRNLRKKNPNFSYPKGLMLECQTNRLFYGFNASEARNTLIIGNKFEASHVYGVSIHDRAEAVTIAENKILHTEGKHGVFIARNADNNWVFGNNISGSGMSGIMLDRSSRKNSIINNTVQDNRGDGITLFESQDNGVSDNIIRRNEKNGLRIRNSWNISANDNLIYRNGETGIHVYSYDISDNSARNFEVDPFVRRADIIVHGGLIGLNKGGALRASDFDFMRLNGVNLLLPFGKTFLGNLDQFGEILMKALMQSKNGIEIIRRDDVPKLKQKIVTLPEKSVTQ